MKSKSTLCLLVISILSLIVFPGRGQAQSPDITPLGIALEELAYPFPVEFQAMEVEGEAVRMAYMDVAPSGQPNGAPS